MLGGSLGAGTVQGGYGWNNGSSFGSGIFLAGAEAMDLAPAVGETLTIAGVIADEDGSEPGYSADQGTIFIDGPGTVILDATNTFEGGIFLTEGTLVLGAAGAAGGGDIVFANNLITDPAVQFTIADAPTNQIAAFGAADVLDITDLSEAGVCNILPPTTPVAAPSPSPARRSAAAIRKVSLSSSPTIRGRSP